MTDPTTVTTADVLNALGRLGAQITSQRGMVMKLEASVTSMEAKVDSMIAAVDSMVAAVDSMVAAVDSMVAAAAMVSAAKVQGVEPSGRGSPNDSSKDSRAAA